MSKPVLFDYWRSSASYRVRIALNLKGIEHERIAVDLLSDAQKSDDYRTRNPQGLVPMLEIDGQRIAQSLAIIAYLEALHPEPRLLPTDPKEQAHVRAMSLLIAADIHPLNNLRVLKRLKALGIDDAARDDWYRHWVREGFAALEALASPRAGTFLFGESPTLGDVCLVPQMYNARRFSLDLEPFPTLVRADATANALEAFAAAHPDRVAPPPASN